MVTYERNIQDKLFILRLFFISLTITLFISTAKNFVNLHYVIITALIFGSLIKATTIKIFNREIKVKRYFIFGLLPLTWIYNKEKDNIQLHKYYDQINSIDSETMLDLIGIFFQPKVKFQFMSIRSHKLTGRLSDINVKLTDYEYQLISEIVSKKPGEIN